MGAPDELTIRKAVLDDQPAVQHCVDSAYALYISRMGKAPAPMLDDYGDLIGRGVVHLAERNGELVGLIVMWAKTDHLYIDNIAVDPAAQGSGAGAALLAHADSEAERAGHDEIQLYTNVAMTENLDYYPRRGFTESHRATDAGYERVYFSRKLDLNR